MNIDHPDLTAQERLAISRRALLDQLNGGRHEEPHEPMDASDGADFPPPGRRRQRPMLQGVAWVPVARSVARRWWQHHPANAAAHLALPVIERVAREQPLKLVAGAAAVGALVVLVKPWRLLSLTALAAAVFKTSDLAGVVTALMQRKSNPPPKGAPR